MEQKVLKILVSMSNVSVRGTPPVIKPFASAFCGLLKGNLPTRSLDACGCAVQTFKDRRTRFLILAFSPPCAKQRFPHVPHGSNGHPHLATDLNDMILSSLQTSRIRVLLLAPCLSLSTFSLNLSSTHLLWYSCIWVRLF